MGKNEIILIRQDEDYPPRTYVDKATVDDGVDIKQAIRAAASEYLRTEEGKKYLDDNNGCFNYTDAIDTIPDEITEKHGYIIRNPVDYAIYEVSANEDIVPEDLSPAEDA